MISVQPKVTIHAGNIAIKEEKGCLPKIWSAVIHFFRQIGEAIQQGAKWTSQLFAKKKVVPLKGTSLERKFQRYKNLPSHPGDFQKEAIALFASHLPGGEKKKFRSNWNQKKGDPRVTAAFVRGYIFSEVHTQFDFGPFSKHSGRLNQLRALFNRLNYPEKAAVLNTIESRPDKGVKLSTEAKNILEAIQEISTETAC